MNALAQKVLAGDKKAIARAISSVEDGGAESLGLLKEIFPHTGKALIVGITGSPGAGKSTVARALDGLARRFDGREHEPFQRAATFRNAYLTDLWQELIDSGIRLDPVLIDGYWREIDTGQDLERARQLVESSPKEWS